MHLLPCCVHSSTYTCRKSPRPPTRLNVIIGIFYRVGPFGESRLAAFFFARRQPSDQPKRFRVLHRGGTELSTFMHAPDNATVASCHHQGKGDASQAGFSLALLRMLPCFSESAAENKHSNSHLPPHSSKQFTLSQFYSLRPDVCPMCVLFVQNCMCRVSISSSLSPTVSYSRHRRRGREVPLDYTSVFPSPCCCDYVQNHRNDARKARPFARAMYVS